MEEAQHTRIDFFDVDHTLVRGSSGALFLAGGVRRGLFPPYALLYIPFFYLQYHLGSLKVNAREWRFSIVAGKTRSSLEELSQATFARLKTLVYPAARRLIEELKGQGHEVVMATSSLDLIVGPLAEYLEMDGVIASSLAFEREVCTGGFAGAPLLREKKRERVQEYIRRRGVRWDQCAFYTDSINDLSLLDSVAVPVVVNPDPRLRRIARKRGWRVLKFPKEP